MRDILRVVKDKTSEWHSRVESLVPVFSAGFTITEYRRLLESFYGYYAALEPLLEQSAGLALRLPDWQERRKLPWLRDDLSWLGVSEENLAKIPVCTKVPRVDSVARTFGVLYVVEGSTLGGQVISRYLAHSLLLNPCRGISFFGGHGNSTGLRWRTFTDVLCEVADAHNEEDILEAANETFETLWLWLQTRSIAAQALEFAS